jgi:hypothetical protein
LDLARWRSLPASARDLFLEHLQQDRVATLSLVYNSKDANELLRLQGRLQYITDSRAMLEKASADSKELKDGRSATTGY